MGSPPADSVLPAKGMGLLARLGFCRRPFSDDESETAVMPKPATRSVTPEPHVRLRLKVYISAPSAGWFEARLAASF